MTKLQISKFYRIVNARQISVSHPHVKSVSYNQTIILQIQNWNKLNILNIISTHLILNKYVYMHSHTQAHRPYISTLKLWENNHIMAWHYSLYTSIHDAPTPIKSIVFHQAKKLRWGNNWTMEVELLSHWGSCWDFVVFEFEARLPPPEVFWQTFRPPNNPQLC